MEYQDADLGHVSNALAKTLTVCPKTTETVEKVG